MDIITCPRCQRTLLLRKSRNNRKYYGHYPDKQCDFFRWQSEYLIHERMKEKRWKTFCSLKTYRLFSDSELSCVYGFALNFLCIPNVMSLALTNHFLFDLIQQPKNIQIQTFWKNSKKKVIELYKNPYDLPIYNLHTLSLYMNSYAISYRVTYVAKEWGKKIFSKWICNYNPENITWSSENRRLYYSHYENICYLAIDGSCPYLCREEHRTTNQDPLDLDQWKYYRPLRQFFHPFFLFDMGFPH